ncbi:hypothetical protein OIU76_003055 [Salix suchowensis]|nr:hypothetical protein OIU76_003055 [Salix suchowensis]
MKGNTRKPFATKRAYFYWVTREQGSFEWFRGVMNESPKQESRHILPGPNWRKVFKHVAVNYPDQRVGVFYCGAPGINRRTKKISSRFLQENFNQIRFP